ncbi:MAG: flagellar assembly protein FliW [Rickettsiales bacterium]
MLGTTEPKEMIAKQPSQGLHSRQVFNESESMANKENETAEKLELDLPGPRIEKIKSRFGEITVDKEKAILFPVGILGMPDKHHFVLTDFPNPKLKQFKLLQSLDDHELSFITLPIELDNGIVDKTDIEHACKDMEISTDDLGLVMIVSVHRSIAGVQLSVNARAPIFVDAGRRAAAQYVFTSNKYKVQHYITETQEKAEGKE